MKTDLAKVMSKRTEEELIEISSILKRDNYQPEAVKAAKKELQKRQIDAEQFLHDKQQKTEKKPCKKEVCSKKVTSWTRLINLIIDLIGIMVTSLIVVTIVTLLMPSPEEKIILKLTTVLILASFFLYYVWSEYKFQKTIGKMLTKTKVVMSNGEKPNLSVILIRTVCRLIPFERISYLFSSNGWHDRISRTKVIKDN